MQNIINIITEEYRKHRILSGNDRLHRIFCIKENLFSCELDRPEPISTYLLTYSRNL